MAPLSNLFVLLALSSGKVLADPTAARLGDLLSIVSIDIAPLVTEIVTTTKTYPATTPTTYTSSTYDTDCQCYYSTIYWWTPHPQPYPTTTSHTTKPASTVTVTKTTTTTVATTTTVTATATVTAPCTPSLSCDKYGYLIQNVTLFQVDLSTGEFSQIANHVGNDNDINAIAYNTLDNLLYARQGAEIIRIGSDGTVEDVATSPSGSSGNVGDIDTDGYYCNLRYSTLQRNRRHARPEHC
ncbi:hypothetical protein O1611_g7789 [Lasiodiplodia mahajangana]|uniref:Uncharacterized protein n=1 Tax=Lasiodiplodia mahajangana TaxID=1108764 RepID=A0ACC2JET1_9PEZI|nr:hypothetical protein O1611_g7789 [Lasiodiplodia mahajangana]